jgi:mannan endo-1,6-alpha-mannosidase
MIQMASLAIIGANLINPSMIPLTLRTGATSQSDPTAGSDTGSKLPTVYDEHITTADKAGAGILTVMMAGIVMGGSYWIST